MVKSVVESRQFSVMISVLREDETSSILAMQSGLSFMQAGDYAEHAVNYFRYAILDHTDWRSIEIEVGGLDGTLDLIEITRD